MKRDGRTLDHGTLETIRTMAVERVREGERPSEVIASYGFHRCTIYGWLKVARRRGQGLKALAARPATGRPRTLTAAQERQVFRWVNGKTPRQYGFDFGLWTRQIVRELIAQRFHVHVSLASIGAVLARQGLTPQKPLQRAYQRDPAAIARWQRETYPALYEQPSETRLRSISGMNRAFAPMPCRARLGVSRARRRWCRSPASARVSAPPRRSVPRAPSGSPPIPVA